MGSDTQFQYEYAGHLVREVLAIMTTMCSKRVGGFYLHGVYTYDSVNCWIQ